MTESLFFNGWSTMLRTVLVGPLAYVALILFLRISGKRTLATLNAFDLIVTVALGSTLSTIAVSSDVALADGALALALLIALQWLITWSSVRWRRLRRVITGEPSLLVYDSQLLHEALRRARVTESEVRAAIRSEGHAAIENVHAVVLETNGSFSVIARDASQTATDLVRLEQ